MDPAPPPLPKRQKFATVYVDNSAYAKGEFIKTTFAGQHGLVEEHLSKELAEGWRILSVAGLGGNSDGMIVRGWFAVVLEMP